MAEGNVQTEAPSPAQGNIFKRALNGLIDMMTPSNPADAARFGPPGAGPADVKAAEADKILKETRPASAEPAPSQAPVASTPK